MEWVIAPVLAIGVASMWVTESVRHSSFVRAILVLSALVGCAVVAFFIWLSAVFANP
jgi:hypothetical protein